MVLTAYPIRASDTQNILSSGIEVNSTQSINPVTEVNSTQRDTQNILSSGIEVNSTQRINPGNRFNTIPQQFQERGLFMKDTFALSFTTLSTDEKLIVMYEQLISTQKMIQNLLIIIAILFFVILNRKSS